MDHELRIKEAEAEVWKQIVEEKKRNLKALEKEAADIQTAVAALKECEMTRDNTQSQWLVNSYFSFLADQMALSMARTAVGSLVVLLVHVETRLQTNITNATAAAETLNACSEKFAEMQNNTPWMQSLREEQAELDASKEKLSSMQMRLEDARAKYQHSLELLKRYQKVKLTTWIPAMIKEAKTTAKYEKKLARLLVYNQKLQQRNETMDSIQFEAEDEENATSPAAHVALHQMQVDADLEPRTPKSPATPSSPLAPPEAPLGVQKAPLPWQKTAMPPQKTPQKALPTPIKTQQKMPQTPSQLMTHTPQKPSQTPQKNLNQPQRAHYTPTQSPQQSTPATPAKASHTPLQTPQPSASAKRQKTTTPQFDGMMSFENSPQQRADDIVNFEGSPQLNNEGLMSFDSPLGRNDNLMSFNNSPQSQNDNMFSAGSNSDGYNMFASNNNSFVNNEGNADKTAESMMPFDFDGFGGSNDQNDAGSFNLNLQQEQSNNGSPTPFMTFGF